jgi:hypothetical protein
MNHPHWSPQSSRIKQLLISLKGLNQPSGGAGREWCDQMIDLLQEGTILMLRQPGEHRSPYRTLSGKGPTSASPFEAQGTPQLVRTLMGFSQPWLLQHPYRFSQANNAWVGAKGQIQNCASAMAEASDQKQSRQSRGLNHRNW